MSKDRYSDDHTIEILQGNNLNITTTDLTVDADSNITNTVGGNLTNQVDGTVYDVIGGDIDVQAVGTVEFATSAGGIELDSYGGIELDSETGSIDINGYTSVNLECVEFPNTIKIEENGIDIESADYIFLHGSADGGTPDGADDTLYGTQVQNGIYADYILCDNISTGAGANNIIDWSDINPDLSFNFNGEYGREFNINLSSGDFSMVISGGTNGADIFAPGEVGIGSGILTYIDSVGMIKIGSGEGTQFEASTDPDGLSPPQRCAIVTINANDYVTIATSPATSGSGTNNYVLKVENEDGTSNADGIQIDLNSLGAGGAVAGDANNWIQFAWDGASTGAIQGAEDEGSGFGYYGWANDGSTDHVIVDSAAHTEIVELGNVQFISGSADFGEFFEAGDINEWKEYNVSYDANKSVNTLGLPEGLVVWVDENKFYRKKKKENSLPMFITKRAIIVGDGTALLKDHPNNIAGQVLSFAGKLPVLVKGSVNSGDFLIPVDNEGYCIGISKENASLKDYFSVMGTALKSCEDIVTLPDDHPSAPGEETDMKLVLCAVGKK